MRNAPARDRLPVFSVPPRPKRISSVRRRAFFQAGRQCSSTRQVRLRLLRTPPFFVSARIRIFSFRCTMPGACQARSCGPRQVSARRQDRLRPVPRRSSARQDRQSVSHLLRSGFSPSHSHRQELLRRRHPLRLRRTRRRAAPSHRRRLFRRRRAAPSHRRRLFRRRRAVPSHRRMPFRQRQVSPWIPPRSFRRRQVSPWIPPRSFRRRQVSPWIPPRSFRRRRASVPPVQVSSSAPRRPSAVRRLFPHLRRPSARRVRRSGP